MLLITMSRCSHCNYRGWGVPASDILTRCFHQPIKCLGKKKPVFSYLNYIFHMPHGQKQAQYLGSLFSFPYSVFISIPSLPAWFTFLSIFQAQIYNNYLTTSFVKLKPSQGYLPVFFKGVSVGQPMCRKSARVRQDLDSGILPLFLFKVEQRFGCQLFFPTPLMPPHYCW